MPDVGNAGLVKPPMLRGRARMVVRQLERMRDMVPEAEAAVMQQTIDVLSGTVSQEPQAEKPQAEPKPITCPACGKTFVL